jgi:short-subunit dehydrogenase
MGLEKFKDKVVWITGASSGIGKELALALADLGAKLVLSSRGKQALDEIKASKQLSDDRCMVVPMDLSDMSGVDQMVNEVVKHFGRIDYLINNGGISQRSFSYETGVEVDRMVFETNFFGTVALTKAVMPIMIEQGSGHISATSSIVGKFGFPLRSAYSASKHALHGFFESVRAELVEKGIKVAMIIPGRILTQISVNAVTKDGEKHGELDKGQAEGMKADVAAQKILKGLAAEKKEILVGGKELLMVHIRRFLPRLYYKMSSKVNPK